MSLKTGLKLTLNYSFNFSVPKRSKKRIQFIILHYTGMKNESDAIKRLCDYKSKVSAHYMIKYNGEILNLVPDQFEAWHAGKSSWKNYKSLNKYSIGIEISNLGHKHGYKNFPNEQILSLIKLLNYLIKTYNIKSKNILGHSDISPSRKVDPGEKFPWQKLAKKGLSCWHNLNTRKLKEYRNMKLNSSDSKKFMKNLNNFGYSKIQGLNLSKNKFFLVKAFQRRFRQSLINGKIDKECFLIIKNLIKR